MKRGTAIVLCSLMVGVLGRAGAADGGNLSRVELKDGRVIEGALRRLEPSRYLVQTEKHMYELSGDEMASVDGDPGEPDLPVSGRVLQYETYEVVRAAGEVDLWSNLRVANETSSVWTSTQWGAMERELPMARNMKVYDKFGNHLEHRVEPRAGTDLYNVIVDFAVPVGPGESLTLSRHYPAWDSVSAEGPRHVFTFAGDFTEDRILYRKVKLPPGAEIVAVSPEAVQRFEHEGSPVVVWRRFYPAGEVFPLTVEYRLR